jgi:ribokinase
MVDRSRAGVVVVGQVARDLVLCVDEVPGANSAVSASRRLELLGGKGANHAVALTQLGVPAALLGVVGDDRVADPLLRQAADDGIDVRPVVRRAGARTGLVVNLVDRGGHWHYVEDLPEDVLLTEDDVHGAAAHLRAARCVVVQLQQPSAAALAAALAADGLVVLEGAPADDERRDPLLARADVLRADAKEARMLTGTGPAGADEVVRAARDLLARHDLALVALGFDGGGDSGGDGSGESGDVFVWRDGARVSSHGDAKVVDTTGAGDALSAGLTSVLLRGGGPDEAAELAVAAAAATVEHPGGRPNLTPKRLRHFLRRERLRAG